MIGLIVNPAAGIGGRVGLKGSDGEETVREALFRGAVPESGRRAAEALKALKNDLTAFKYEDLTVVTCPGSMGEDSARAAGFPYALIGSSDGRIKEPHAATVETTAADTIDAADTTAADSIRAAELLSKAGAKLILFAGGDGTARDIMNAVSVPVLGIPAGCKMHSAVFAETPAAAGRAAADFIRRGYARTVKAEVMDINEELFREGIVEAKLYGYAEIPETGLTQGKKSGNGGTAPDDISGLAEYLAETLEDDKLWIVGGGSTTYEILKTMGLEGTLLGVDLLYGKKLLKKDAAEKDILTALSEHEKAGILVTVIGGQGCLFGRGNQQISPAVLKKIKKENIVIAASNSKMNALMGRALFTDTGDPDTDRMLSGYYKVVTGWKMMTMVKCSLR